MQQSLEKVLPKLRIAGMFLHRYGSFLFVIVFLVIYVWLVQYIGQIIQSEPSQSAIDSKLKPISRLKIDQDAVKKITELEAQNVETKSLFDQARQNPFTE